ncbi:MAG: beta-N-acetylglucosaminidase domain-containing protein [Propionicimonas sp.]
MRLPKPSRRYAVPFVTVAAIAAASLVQLPYPAGAATPTAGPRAETTAAPTGAGTSSAEVPSVHPTPTHIDVVNPPLQLAGPVRVVTTTHTDAAALDAVVDLLRNTGVTAVHVAAPGESVSKGTRSTPTPHVAFTVVVGEVGDEVVTARLKAAELTVPDVAEGYALAVNGAASDPSVVIGGADGAGQFYGVQTLRQLVLKSRGRSTLAGAEVTDRPALPLRGTIEGFYGAPWTHADRLRQLAFLGAHKMNTYVYAPKDDPYHRELWRQPYPADKLAELATLVAASRDQHVAFWFAISPGATVCYSSDEDFDALTAKATQMWDIGVRSFSLLLDDIDPALRCAADRARFGADKSPAAAAQAFLLNRLRAEFLSVRPGASRLLTVPTEYSQPSTPTPYTQRFAELVDPSVLVMWTGSSPFGSTGGDDVRRAREIYGHDVMMWDNYPVNDFARNRLFLGPLRGRGSDVATAGMSGYVSNPMNQAAASEIPLFTVGDYTWNPAAYDPETSWDAALRELGGRGYDALRTLAENSQSWYLHREESPDLVSAFERLWAAYESGSSLDVTAQDLLARLAELEDLPAALRGSLDDPSLLSEVAGHVDKLALLAKAAEAATRMLLAQENDEGGVAWEKRQLTESARADAGQTPQEIASAWTEINKPGRSLIDEFVARALKANDRWLGLSDADTRPTSVQVWGFDRNGDAEGWVAGHSVGPISVNDGALTTAVTGADPYLVQNLAFSVDPSCGGGLVAEVTLGVDTAGSGQIFWATQARPGFSEDKMVAFDVSSGAPTTYRIALDTATSPLTQLRVDLPDNAGNVTVDAVRILVDRVEPTGSASGGPPAASGSSFDRAVDGCLATGWQAARRPETGEALVLDLVTPRPLDGVVILQDPKRAATADVQVRAGGLWHSVGSVDSGYGQAAAGGLLVDAIRLAWVPGQVAPTVVEIIPFYGDGAGVAATLTGPPGGAVEMGSSFPMSVSLTSTGLSAITGTLEVSAPDGWKVEPAHTEVAIPRGRDLVTQVQVTTPAGVSAGSYTMTATLTVAGGQTIAKSADVRVVPPVKAGNLALGGTATSSSVELELPQFTPPHAIDGDPATRWASAATDDQWVQVELPQAARLATAVLRWEAAYGSAYRVQVSHDGTSWTDVASVTGGDGGVDEVRFDSVDPVRFLRIQGVHRATDYGYSLYELEVYEAAGAA